MIFISVYISITGYKSVNKGRLKIRFQTASRAVAAPGTVFAAVAHHSADIEAPFLQNHQLD